MEEIMFKPESETCIDQLPPEIAGDLKKWAAHTKTIIEWCRILGELRRRKEGERAEEQEANFQTEPHNLYHPLH